MTLVTRTLPAIGLAGLLVACGAFSNPVVAPVLIIINGAASPGGPVGSTVILQGAAFGDQQGSGRVLFSTGTGIIKQATVASASDWNTGTIVTTVPTGLPPGNVAVTVTNGNGLTGTGVVFAVTPDEAFTPSGVTWTAGPTLSSPVSGAGVTYAKVQGNGYVYAVGGAGASGAPVDTVRVASVGATGTLGAWTTTTKLPTALAFTAVAAATPYNSFASASPNGYLYVFGGTTDAAGTPVSTVYRAPLNSDGSVGSWTSITGLPTPLRSAGAVALYGQVFVLGGAAGGNVPVAAVYRSAIQADGSLKVDNQTTWKAETSLPAPRARFGLATSGLYLYVVGGDSAVRNPNDAVPSTAQVATIFYARATNGSHDITSWTTAATALLAARSAFPAASSLGGLLITGGLYGGASAHTSEAAYAALNADGTVGTFTTASPATSINSLCSCNPFNSGGTGYIAGNGTFHVVIVGGDDVSAAGTRRAETFTY